MTSYLRTSPWSAQDQARLASYGISGEDAERQLERFRDPPKPPALKRPCRIGDGILRRLPEADHAALLATWRRAARSGSLSKFVPASGAASRMFEELPAGKETGRGEQPTKRWLRLLERLPRPRLGTPELDHAERPKALLPFHWYKEGARTPFEEHLVEATDLVRDDAGVCRTHFTVRPIHLTQFERAATQARAILGPVLGARLEISFSLQAPTTDTLAVGPNNLPVRLPGGDLVLRPAGSGTLIHNLSAMGGEIVFIKNIDNVVYGNRQRLVSYWKRLLAGHLVRLRDRIFELLESLHRPVVATSVIEEALGLIRRDLGGARAAGLDGRVGSDLRRLLVERLDRPLRVCGMIEYQGRYGGRPCWVAGPNGEETLQIVEAPQLDSDAPRLRAVIAASTHFNPVDLVCSIRGWRGDRFDLNAFVDDNAWIVDRKIRAGRRLKTLERPSLWGGAMAGWNTVFIDVPAATFAPVKTLFDLLCDEHQTEMTTPSAVSVA